MRSIPAFLIVIRVHSYALRGVSLSESHLKHFKSHTLGIKGGSTIRLFLGNGRRIDRNWSGAVVDDGNGALSAADGPL